MEKVLDIIDQVSNEKKISSKTMIEAIKNSMIEMAKRKINKDAEFLVVEDEATRNLKLIQKVTVCSAEEFTNENTQITLDSAREFANNIKIGDILEYTIDIESLGQDIKDFGFSLVENKFEDLNIQKIKVNIGKLVTGRISSINKRDEIIVNMGEYDGILPLKNKIKGEKFNVGDMIQCILKVVNKNGNNLTIELSRTTPKMLEELLKLEVPEIKENEVEIFKSCRIPGEKAKIALISHNPRIDPIGSAVGNKGMRIKSISKELNGENIDCIEYSSDPRILIKRALIPAEIISIKIENKEGLKPVATVEILKSEKSKAIGKNGVNIRLASMLTDHDIILNEVDQEYSGDKKLGFEALESLFKKQD